MSISTVANVESDKPANHGEKEINEGEKRGIQCTHKESTEDPSRVHIGVLSMHPGELHCLCKDSTYQ